MCEYVDQGFFHFLQVPPVGRAGTGRQAPTRACCSSGKPAIRQRARQLKVKERAHDTQPNPPHVVTVPRCSLGFGCPGECVFVLRINRIQTVTSARQMKAVVGNNGLGWFLLGGRSSGGKLGLDIVALLYLQSTLRFIGTSINVQPYSRGSRRSFLERGFTPMPFGHPRLEFKREGPAGAGGGVGLN